MPDEKRVYKLLITKGIDPDGQYDFYKERIDSQRDFSYMEYNTEENELTDELFNDIDVIVLLFGLYHDNQELFEELLDKSKEFDVPILLVRFFGMEFILKELEEKSDAVVGWNPGYVFFSCIFCTDLTVTFIYYFNKFNIGI